MRSLKFSKRLIVSVLVTCFVLLIIYDLFPTQRFYEKNFKENTQITMPISKEPILLLGNNSIFNLGDYNITYTYKFSVQDFQSLRSQMTENGFIISDSYLETDENEKALQLSKPLEIEIILTRDFGFKNYDALFMNDKQTIIFNSNKW